jgi:hypothetical protein
MPTGYWLNVTSNSSIFACFLYSYMLHCDFFMALFSLLFYRSRLTRLV